MNLSKELEFRGFVNQTTITDNNIIDKQKLTFYWGVDPSSSSMQIGNLAAGMMARCFMRHGHKAVILIGGATGLIGDPDGKKEERQTKTLNEIESNKKNIVNQYKKIFQGLDFEVVDNYDWFKDINYLSFLDEVGRHVPMRQMVNRDFVKSRLSEDGSGISYAEFSYVLIQAYDFYYLNKNYGVELQLCGSDQWGNSIAGVDLTRRINGNEVHVWSTPLIIDKTTGKKFGKSEGGAVWLDPNLTSPYKFYQFWLNVDDDSVIDYLKVFTNIDPEELATLSSEFNQARHLRSAQKVLAYYVTSLIHGQDQADQIVKISECLFGENKFSDLTDQDKKLLTKELPFVNFTSDIATVLVESGLASSKTQARTLISQGSISINDQKISEDNDNLLNSELNLIKKGKNSFAIVKK